jgi:hypothetical protein
MKADWIASFLAFDEGGALCETRRGLKHTKPRHCEARSDEAIQNRKLRREAPVTFSASCLLPPLSCGWRMTRPAHDAWPCARSRNKHPFRLNRARMEFRFQRPGAGVGIGMNLMRQSGGFLSPAP